MAIQFSSDNFVHEHVLNTPPHTHTAHSRIYTFYNILIFSCTYKQLSYTLYCDIITFIITEIALVSSVPSFFFFGFFFYFHYLVVAFAVAVSVVVDEYIILLRPLLYIMYAKCWIMYV